MNVLGDTSRLEVRRGHPALLPRRESGRRFWSRGDHWQPYLGDAPDRIAADQIEFLRRQGLLGA